MARPGSRTLVHSQHTCSLECESAVSCINYQWQSCGNRVAVARQTCGSRDCCGRGNGHGADHRHDIARAMAMGNTVFESKILDKTGRLMQPSQHGMKIYIHVRVAFLLFHSPWYYKSRNPRMGVDPNQLLRKLKTSCGQSFPLPGGRAEAQNRLALYQQATAKTWNTPRWPQSTKIIARKPKTSRDQSFPLFATSPKHVSGSW